MAGRSLGPMLDRTLMIRRGAGVLGVLAIIAAGLLTERATRQKPPA